MNHSDLYVKRDDSWLSFNERVLQEAMDKNISLLHRIKFLGIFSNNLDEFFRTRVPTLQKMYEYNKLHHHATLGKRIATKSPLEKINRVVISQQMKFIKIWEQLVKEMKEQNVWIVNDRNINKAQKQFIRDYFEDHIRVNVIPIMLESFSFQPYLKDKSIYLGIVMSKKGDHVDKKKNYALIEIPTASVDRFIRLPNESGKQYIILLEDIIRYNLPNIFSFFGYDTFKAYLFKITKNAEMDFDNDLSVPLVQKIEKALKGRRKGATVRFVYDKYMDADLLAYLKNRLGMNKHSNIIPGGVIHNFRDFMNFPDVFTEGKLLTVQKPMIHHLFKNANRITEVILDRDVLLSFPYHSFDSLIDFLREAAIDPYVHTIKITAYRLSSQSKIINALVNAARNGKKVFVVIELKARFDEEANLNWKSVLEEEGIKVFISPTNLKVHAKICLVKRKVNNQEQQYGFISTGNLNEKTALVYSDFCLFTAHKIIMEDLHLVFAALEDWKNAKNILKDCRLLITSPFQMRIKLKKYIEKEIDAVRQHLPAGIALKLNALSDIDLIKKLFEAAQKGVDIQLVIRSIYCDSLKLQSFKKRITAISIVDEYLEHARVLHFKNVNKDKVYISSADWMFRNLEHRFEVAVPILDSDVKKELLDILKIQLSDNVKARVLDTSLSNKFVSNNLHPVRAQKKIYQYLVKKKYSL
ncbi:MAG: polyphosphate kinase 1 [Phycisphaerales bacterium]|nr:polyphosphate kinase 1 [Phycisphaerales bacterium]